MHGQHLLVDVPGVLLRQEAPLDERPAPGREGALGQGRFLLQSLGQQAEAVLQPDVVEREVAGRRRHVVRGDRRHRILAIGLRRDRAAPSVISNQATDVPRMPRSRR
jgi:hypothetical protein